MPAGNEPHLSIVIPAFNEAARLPASLRALAEFCARQSYSHEVLVVVEKSTDGTLELARDTVAGQANFHIIASGVQRGKGFAVRTGMLRAQGEHIFYMDADLSVPLEDIAPFLDCFRARPEIGVLAGNRQHARSRIVKSQALLRRKMGQAFNRVLQGFALSGIRDTQCGFKAFRKSAAREIFTRQRLDGFAFDVEVLLLAQRLGCGIADLPVQWANSTESKVRILRDSLQMLRDAVRVRRLVERTMREMPVGE